ncbi:calcium-binding protein [Frigidibacter mobilis]|uniref:Hemolysin-type calcium-binding repeat family protein n=1 Tax=Frigidibacter mobilis TaxID=1335048 RepID=A0A161H294_9RHOB|nr:calcium-binding protein [Frigidibacter mobilis]AMY71413.1 hemolysin-type calcium-binding repeat family protein [Frigidibacter mobilis]
MLVLTGLLGLMVAGSMMDFSFLSRKEDEEADEDQIPESSGDHDEENARGDLWDEWDDPPEAAAETGWDDMAGEVAPPAEDPAAPDWNAADSGVPDADTVAVPPRQDLSGGPEDDIIAGGGGDDVLQGLGGDDQMNGGAGNDLLVGGTGADDLHAGAGNDTLLGGEGDDSLHGQEGDDLLLGGAGDDTVAGHGGDDILLGGDGDDRLIGGEGNDTLRGEAGDDSLEGGLGDDHLDGGAGRDTLYGNDGNDTLVGVTPHDSAADADYLNGGRGDDRLILGAGDTGSGGEDADTFVLGDWLMGGDAVAVIADYDPAQDQIVLAYDPAAHPAPEVTVEHEGTTAHVLIDGIRIAEVTGAASLAADGILLIGTPDILETGFPGGAPLAA